jgi:hypothetical protein
MECNPSLHSLAPLCETVEFQRVSEVKVTLLVLTTSMSAGRVAEGIASSIFFFLNSPLVNITYNRDRSIADVWFDLIEKRMN